MSNPKEPITEQEVHQNPLLMAPVDGDTELKVFLVNYTGDRLQPANEEVTIHMIAETIAAEFPEFMFAVAEENFLRGYQLGLEDATTLTTEAKAVTGNEE
tara:strand:- start:40584 stop:40883 length:300 start_codon:yes stop_codon:yes gene_type:complete